MKWALQDKKKKKYSIKRFCKSFKYAFSGIFKAYKSEQNLLVHTIVAIIVLIGGYLLKINRLEFCIIILVIGFILSLELVNTAIEYTVDMAMPNIHPLAKIAKDVASGAVLIASFIAIIIGVIIFLPKIIILF